MLQYKLSERYLHTYLKFSNVIKLKLDELEQSDLGYDCIYNPKIWVPIIRTLLFP